MVGWRLAACLALLTACTKANPAAHCQNGTCTDPNFPFCDVNGVVSGEPGACVAVSCTAGEFAECRGDAEVRCNATGNNYEVVQCERGCDAAADGCRLCNPNETACTNGKVASCDVSGTVTLSIDCPLGCFEAEPRCRDIAPSNGLAKYLDMVPTAMDLTLEDASLYTDTGEFTLMPSGMKITPQSFLMSAPPGGVQVRVFVVNKLAIQRLQIGGLAAAAFVARDEVSITGVISVGGGASAYAGCEGGYGEYRTYCTNSAGGGGGGAHASNGAAGGSIPLAAMGGGGGIASGNPALVPLRGGCSGGGVDGLILYSGGGGAIQIASQKRINVTGTVDASGGNGTNFDVGNNQGPMQGFGASGGGGGGGILLEAPTVTLSATAKLLAAGGNGGALCSTSTSTCGVGGMGAHVNASATPGVDASNACPTGTVNRTAGGGGGGLGRIRINTRDGAYAKTNTTVEDADLTTGTIVTR